MSADETASWFHPEIPPSGPGCVECEATAGWWFHLRRCVTCGHVGCCDSSPSQHASRHARADGHPIAGSFEPGEDWYWITSRRTSSRDRCSRRRSTIRSTRPSRAREDRVPADWEDHLH